MGPGSEFLFFGWFREKYPEIHLLSSVLKDWQEFPLGGILELCKPSVGPAGGGDSPGQTPPAVGPDAAKGRELFAALMGVSQAYNNKMCFNVSLNYELTE